MSARLLLFLCCLSLGHSGPSPALFIPGDGGNRLYAKLDRPSVEHWYCFKKYDWYLYWLQFSPFVLPSEFNCFIENGLLQYNHTSGSYSNVEGVSIRVDPPGETKGMEYLDDDHFLDYYGSMIADLRKHGYNSTNLKGLSFDWRYTPVLLDEPDGEIGKMKSLVEQLFEDNNGQKVVIVTHSMGGPVTQAFLERMSQDWKDKYIESWVPIASPLFGAAQAVASFSSGYNLGHRIVPKYKLGRGLRTWPSTAWLIPQAKYWNSQPIVITPTRNYTASVDDMKQFFEDLQHPLGWTMYQQVRPVLKYEPPRVPINCIYGTGVKTPEQFRYKSPLPDTEQEDPETVYGAGDGTVNVKSSQGCLLWQQDSPIKGFQISGVEHVDLLSNRKVIDIVRNILIQ